MPRSIWRLSLLTVLLCAACGEAKRGSSTDAPRIAIVYTAPHPVINEIIAGFKEVVTARFPSAEFRDQHANGRPEEYSAAVLASLSGQPSLLAPITTPIAKIAVEESRGRVPVVFMGVTDPVGAGVARSLERPGLATGSSDLCPFQALLSIAHDLLPRGRVLGLPYNPSDEPAVFGRKRLMELAPAHGFSVVDRQVTSRDELPADVRGLAQRTDAIIIAADNLMMENPDVVVASSESERRPVFACDATSVEKGAVAGVSVSYRDVGRAAGRLAVRVLQGEAPDTLPIAVLSSGGIVVNKRAACTARVTLDSSFMARVARTIDSGFVCPARR